MTTRRRDLLIAAGAIAVAMSLPRIRRLFDPPFDFEPISGLPGFRRLAGGAISSAGPVALIGVERLTKQQEQLRAEVSGAPCLSVFGQDRWPADKVPVAVFTDYNCPYCPVLSDLIIDLIHVAAPIDVVWRDLPVLGPRSEDAARAALAAAEQGQYLPVHQRLMRTVLRPGPHALSALARDFDMDSTRFLHDVTAPETAAKLELSKAIAAVFGIIGTPAILVGRSLVVGKIDRDRLAQLIALELETPFDNCTNG